MERRSAESETGGRGGGCCGFSWACRPLWPCAAHPDKLLQRPDMTSRKSGRTRARLEIVRQSAIHVVGTDVAWRGAITA